MKKRLIPVLLLTLLLTLTFSMTVFAEETETVVTNTASNIRSGPSTSDDKVATVKKGTELQRTAVLENGWSEVQYNGQTCYISSKLIVPQNTDAATQSQNTAASSATAKPATVPAEKVSGNWTFVPCQISPKGLQIWNLKGDDGTWPDELISAYDATGITNDMSDYDKAVAINNYVCQTLSYEDLLNGDTPEKITWECLIKGKANCQGYAQAFDCLCSMAGIGSNCVYGEGTTPDGVVLHAWNYVYADGTKYWVDVCWNDSTGNAYLMSTSEFTDHKYVYEK